MIILLLLTGALANGQRFDAEIFPPEMSEGLHKLLKPSELHYMFGTEDPQAVDTSQYVVVALHNTLHQERDKAKRNGEKEPDAAFKLDMFGNEYNMRLEKIRSLLAPHAKVQFREGNHSYTMRMTNKTYEVQWLEAAIDYSEDYSEEDNSAWTKCDNYIWRSTIAETEIWASIADCYEEDMDDIIEDDDTSGNNFILDHSNENYYYPHKVKTFRDLSGIVFDNNNKETFELYSVPERIQKIIQDYQREYKIPGDYNNTHHVVVKRATFPEYLDHHQHLTREQVQSEEKPDVVKRSGGHKHVETALFMDSAAYSIYKEYFSQAGYTNPDQRIVHLLLAFMNSIQAIYNFGSLGTKVDFSLVNLEIQKTPQFDDHGGDRGPMLTSFCKYQGGKNPGSDSDPHHWDIGLLVSGVDFWAADGTGKRSHLTMGLSTVTGICTKDYGCVIGEMGVRNSNQKPYPSTGFTSVYVMAHEIGHNLGMSHDSTGNSCPSNGYIMSPSRGTKGETVWSSCSRNYMASLDLPCLTDQPAAQSGDQDHDVYGNYPGQNRDFDADAQCKLLMLTPEAHLDHSMVDLEDICYSLKCRAPGRRGYYRSGPALEGTPCGTNKICHQGSCVRNTVSPGQSNTATWSDWSSPSACRSGCITRSKGYSTKHRTCIKTSPVSFRSNCRGSSTDVNLCTTASCPSYKTKMAFASSMCKKFIKADPRLSQKMTKHGFQPEHDMDRLDLACTVHCKKPSGGWYAPVLELNDRADVDVYFPDGTFCHSQGGTDYFCRNHQCVSGVRGGRWTDKVPNLNVNSNARPDGKLSIPSDAEAYFSLDSNGKPKNNNFHSMDDNEIPDEEWEVVDYIRN